MSAPRRGSGRAGRVLSTAMVAVGLIALLGGFVLAAVLYQPYQVPTGSMQPTLSAGDRVLAHRLDGREVRRGDVVVFRDADWGDLPVVKRVVAVGGDTVGCCTDDGRLLVNGVPVDEPYRDQARPATQQDFEVLVPEKELFLLGDDRMESVDSSSLLLEGEAGTVPRDAVNARVEAVAWPPAHWQLMPAATGFAELPGGVSGRGPLGPLLLVTSGGAVLILVGAALGPLLGRRSARRST